MSRCLRSLQMSVFLIQLLKSCQHCKVAPFKKLSAFLSHAEDRKDMQLMSDMWWHVMTCADMCSWPKISRVPLSMSKTEAKGWSSVSTLLDQLLRNYLMGGSRGLDRRVFSITSHLRLLPSSSKSMIHLVDKTKRQIPIAAYYSQQISTMFNNIPQPMQRFQALRMNSTWPWRSKAGLP